jgi:hypothetical protein
MALAFADDSGSGGETPYYVLAGYSAEESTWDAFWPRWQSVLDLMPRIEYFKMSEAESRKGQFLGFSPDEQTGMQNKALRFYQSLKTTLFIGSSVESPIDPTRKCFLCKPPT